MACGASSYDSSTLRAPSWCFVFFVVSLAREPAGRNFPRSRRPQSRLAVLVEEKAWMVNFRPAMTGLISRASPEAVILAGCLTGHFWEALHVGYPGPRQGAVAEDLHSGVDRTRVVQRPGRDHGNAGHDVSRSEEHTS